MARIIHIEERSDLDWTWTVSSIPNRAEVRYDGRIIKVFFGEGAAKRAQGWMIAKIECRCR